MATAAQVALPLPILPAGWTAEKDFKSLGRLSPATQRNIEPVGPHFLAHARRKRHHRTFSEDERIQAQESVKKVEDDDSGEISEAEDPLMLQRDAKDWKGQDHYAVLGLSKYRFRATEDQIKRAHRKKVLRHHPDKRAAAGGTEDDSFFKCIQKATEILLDPVKRRQFDSVDEGANVEPPTKKQAQKSFFKLWGPVFESEARFSKVQPVPKLGDDNSTKDHVERFYDFWYNFDSWRSFEYQDEDVPDDNENRDQKRHVERKNNNARKKKKTEDTARLRSLVDDCLNGDERIKKFKAEERAGKNKKRLDKEAAERKAKENAVKAKQEAERLQKEKDEAEKAEKAEGKKAKEAAKNAVKKNKRVLKSSVKDVNYFQAGDATAAQIDHVLNDVDLVMGKVDNEELAALASKLNGKKDAADVKGVWSEEVKRLMFPEMTEVHDPKTLSQYVRKCFKSSSLLVLAKALLCFSLYLQQLPASFIKNRLKLPLPADALRHHYACIIEKHILSNDEYVGTLEGLECLVLLTKLDSNDGKPRKTWLASRRGLSFALMMGIHRAPKWKATQADSTIGIRRKMVFMGLFQNDRYYSLLLGLPYAVANNQCDLEKMVEGMDSHFRGMDLSVMVGLSRIGGDLIDRNQNPELVSLEATMKLERDLDVLAAKLPNLSHLTDTSAYSFDELYRHVLSRFFFHNVRSHLHLPFLVNPSNDPRFEFSRHAALESAREMIKSYRALRTHAVNGFCACKVVDFQVLTAAAMLALYHLGVMHRTDKMRDVFAEDQDWTLIAEVKRLLEEARAEMGPGGGSVQDQAARALGLFLEGRKGCAGRPPMEGDSCQIVIPYFGRISIRPRDKNWCIKQEKRGSQHQIPTPISNSASSTPASLPMSWQSPSIGPSQTSVSSVSSGSTPNDTFIAFNPYNLPMPTGFDENSGFGNITNDSVATFNEDLMANFPEWTGGNEWPGVSTDIPLELDNDWNWIVSGVGSA